MVDNKPPRCGGDNARTSKEPTSISNQQQRVAAFGRYQIVKELGRGGMGVVYMAHDPSLKRHVALKIINQSFVSDREKKRFENETYVMAKLSHPNIVKIFDVGEEQGRHFFTMELVAGVGFNRLLEESIPLPRLLQILVKVAQAVHYAHQQGVIHRDIKPSNVMVLRDDEPKVMDFGLAKEIAGGSQQLSQSQDAIGTPYYMSPEQAGQRGRDIDARSDVFSLGVMLYQIVTGKLPFTGDTPMNVMYQTMFSEPVSPSRVNTGIAQDLEAICLKALEKEKNRRYKSAAAFADDLSRYLAGQPVEAKPVTRWIRLGKWVRRHRVTSVVVALATLLLLAGATVSFLRERSLRQLADYQRIEAQKQKLEAERLRQVAEQKNQLAEVKTIEARLSQAESELVLARTHIAAQDYFRAYTRQQNAATLLQTIVTDNAAAALPLHLRQRLVFLHSTTGLLYQCWLWPNPHRSVTLNLEPDWSTTVRVDNKLAGPSLRAWEDVAPACACQHVAVRLPTSFTYFIPQQPSWRFVAGHDPQSEILHIRDINLNKLHPIARCTTRSVIAFSNDHRFMAAGSKNEIMLWDSTTSQLQRTALPTNDTYIDTICIRSLKFSHDSRWLFVASREQCSLLQLPSMQLVQRWPNGGTHPTAAFSRNNKWLAIGGCDRADIMNTKVFALNDPSKESKRFIAKATALCFGPDDQTLLIVENKDIRVCPLFSQESGIITLKGHQGNVYELALSDDGSYLASAGLDRKVVVWDTYAYRPMFEAPLYGETVQQMYAGIVFHPNNRQLAVWSSDYVNLYTWNHTVENELACLDSAKELVPFKTLCRNPLLRSNRNAGMNVAFDRPAKRVACFFATNLLLWDIGQPQAHSLGTLVGEHKNIFFNHDGTLLAWWQMYNIHIWNCETRKKVMSMPLQDVTNIINFLPLTDILVSQRKQRQQTVLQFWYLNAEAPYREIPICSSSIVSRAFNASGDRMAFLSGSKNTIHIGNIQSGHWQDEAQVQLEMQSMARNAMLFSTGTCLATGSLDGEFTVYDWALSKAIASVALYEPISRIWYDMTRSVYWIITPESLWIYPHIEGSNEENRLQEIAQRIYPLPVYAGYPVMAADLSWDFKKLALLLQSGRILLCRLQPETRAKQE